MTELDQSSYGEKFGRRLGGTRHRPDGSSGLVLASAGSRQAIQAFLPTGCWWEKYKHRCRLQAVKSNTCSALLIIFSVDVNATKNSTASAVIYFHTGGVYSRGHDRSASLKGSLRSQMLASGSHRRCCLNVSLIYQFNI